MPMTGRTNRTRLAALGVSVALLATTAAGATAAGPHDFSARDAGRAWDEVATTGDGTATETDQVIVTYDPGTSGAERTAAAADAGLTEIATLGDRTVVYAADDSADATAAQLTGGPLGDVATITPDLRLHRDDDPTDEPGWDLLWGLHNTGQPIRDGVGSANVDIDGLEAESVTGGDPAVVIAVIDDGVDFSHPDLAGRAWTNPGESGGGKETNGIDDDGNGYVDDVHGWDFCNDDKTVHDFDEDFHGTHVAGTIAASLDGQGIVGVAPRVRIMALKFLDNSADCGLTSMAIEAIAYAKSFGVAISNNSWGGRGDPAAFQPLRTAIAGSGMLFVTSAGNQGIDNDTDPSPTFPAAFDLPNIVTVAAADNTGHIASFSNTGHVSVDIAAPGVDIVSALPADSFFPVGWGWLDGTSMAAPHVTGVAALAASRFPSLRGSGAVATLRARILSAGKALPMSVGRTATGRLVDARFALDDVAPVALAANAYGFPVGYSVSTGIRTSIGWPAGTDDASGVRSYTLAQQVGSGGWSTIASGLTSRSLQRTLTFASQNHFRVTAQDGAMNTSAPVGGPLVWPRLYQENTTLARYTGSWSYSKYVHASGGRTRFASKAGASVTVTFTGRAIAVIAPKGSTRGSARAYVDGVYVGVVSAYRSSGQNRMVVFAREWSSSGAHTLKLVVAGTKGHPRFDIDGFVTLR